MFIRPLSPLLLSDLIIQCGGKVSEVRLNPKDLRDLCKFGGPIVRTEAMNGYFTHQGGRVSLVTDNGIQHVCLVRSDGTKHRIWDESLGPNASEELLGIQLTGMQRLSRAAKGLQQVLRQPIP